MSIRSVQKQSSTTGPALFNTNDAAGFIYDTTDGFLKYDDVGTTRALVNTSEAQTITGAITFTAVGQIRVVAVTATNAQFLAVRATPISLVAAPGAGFGLQFLGGWITIDYTGAYTESADNLAVRFTDGSGQIVSGAIEATGFVDATADSYQLMVPLAPTTGPAVVNAALVLHNTGDGEYGGGNAANVITITTYYRVVTVP